ncbi:MAG: VWA domain-containing protein, partial [Calditrichota bacterium]
MKSLLLCLLLSLPLFAGENDVYIIFDGSGSMWQELPTGEYKISAARSVLQKFAAQEFNGQELAMRAYGHRRKNDCSDTELVLPWQSPARFKEQIGSFLSNVNPTGRTPISRSLKAALKDFGDREGSIILISDGIETCDEDPCELLKLWRKKNIRISVHVVGLGLDEKSKAAMQCLADAAGTTYRDANSAEELTKGLKEIREKIGSIGLKIIGKDAEGEQLWPEGLLLQNGDVKYNVTSSARNAVEPGTYQLEVGIRTRNGNLYQPITKQITVADDKDTVVEVTIPRPPSVRAKFIDRGEAVKGALIFAYQAGKEVFRFRWKDEVFLDEGSYEFRTEVNSANALSLEEAFKAGDSKELVFEMIQTVNVMIRFETSGKKEHLRENADLLQNGERKYRVHVHNGGTILPGIYDIHLPHKYCPFTVKEVEISDEAEQNLTFTVPAGY